MTRPILTYSILASLAAAAASAAPPAKKPAAKPAPPNTVKGQGQIAGSAGRFGTVYSLKNGFNFEVISAKYSIEPYNAYNQLVAGTDEKLFILEFAIKNATKMDQFFSTDGLFTAVDQGGQLYPDSSLHLKSKGAADPAITLRPGQGAGQPALNDTLRVAWIVPAKSRIVKVMVNNGRLGTSEEAIRYFLAGATKAEAGEAGDPKNVVAPLPEEVRDPADPSGASALPEGKGKAGVFVPSRQFHLRLDGFTYTGDALMGEGTPAEGKRFAVATITAKSMVNGDTSIFDVIGGDTPLYEITDSQGEQHKPVAYYKAMRNEDADKAFKLGDEYQLRVIFEVPKDAAARKLILGAAGGGRKWAYDVSSIK